MGSAFSALFLKSGVAYRVVSRAEADYTQPGILRNLIEDTGPRALVNCAGYTGKPNVDACEADKAECLFGNAVLPGRIATVCQELELPWGHVSSGCIYSGDGPGGNGFREEDPPNFSFRQDHCSFYSGTKALGEEVLEGVENCYIWRLRIPFENTDNPRNYLTKVMQYDRLLEARNSLSHLDEFVAAAWQCFEKEVPFGIYNLTNPGSVTTREVVEMIRESGVCTKDFQFFDSEEEFMRVAAKTPRSNCVLDSSKAIQAGLEMRPVREALEDTLRHWES